MARKLLRATALLTSAIIPACLIGNPEITGNPPFEEADADPCPPPDAGNPPPPDASGPVPDAAVVDAAPGAQPWTPDAPPCHQGGLPDAAAAGAR